MSTPITIIVAAVILAAALLVAFRWEITVGSGALPFLLDRWTGNVSYCTPPLQPKDTGGFEPVPANPFADLIPNGRGGVALHCKP
jgi:hypothetical protein